MIEFLGGDSLQTVSACYVTAGDENAPRFREPRPIGELPSLWGREVDISRSLWDRQSLLVHLDIEYVNFDHPVEPYLHQVRIFQLQQPLELTIQSVLAQCDIRPLHLLSGRGHHFLWRIRQDSPAFERLRQLGRVNPSLEALNARPHRPNNEPLPPALAQAFSGLGLVIEFFAQTVQRHAMRVAKIPIELAAVEVGPSQHGREMVSFDLSQYGDPLSSRVIRIPFSIYLKPQQQRRIMGSDVVRGLPPVFLIPLNAMNWAEAIFIMHDFREVMTLARHFNVAIPDYSAATEKIIGAYEESSLKKFHECFYGQEQHAPSDWPETYDRLALDELPVCIKHDLEHPNDFLLRPANIRRIVRVFLAEGWHPRHIAGLIRSRIERHKDWGDAWRGYDPATRCDFYTRLFAGLFVADGDDLVDFNCVSAREQKICAAPHCSFNLQDYKTSLLERRKHERLACRPINRLFLPEEHS